MSVYSPPCLTLPYLSGFVLSGKPEVSKGYRFDEDSSNGVPSIRKSYRFNILFGVYISSVNWELLAFTDAISPLDIFSRVMEPSEISRVCKSGLFDMSNEVKNA